MRLSFSSDKLFDNCPRKWQLYKLLATGSDDAADGDVYEGGIVTVNRLLSAAAGQHPGLGIGSAGNKTAHTMYGHAFGTGAATLILTSGDIEQAIWAAFQHWDNTYEMSPKYLEVLFTSLFRLHAKFNYDRYRPLHLADGRPAMELGTRIWLDPDGDQDYYVVYPDIIVEDTLNGRPTIIEVKTTKRSPPLEPLYTNSPQSILYSLPLRFLFPSHPSHAWETMYLVNQIPNVWNPDIYLFSIEHTYEERLGVLMSVMLRYEYITRMRELGFFPKTASGECIGYGRICEFYGICDRLALDSTEQSLEDQNQLDPERESQIVLDLHMQELLAYEMSQTQQDQPTIPATNADY